MDSEWEDITEETEKYAEELDRWMEITHERSRLNIYKEIDTYPVSNLVKIHMGTVLISKIYLKGLLMKR